MLSIKYTINFISIIGLVCFVSSATEAETAKSTVLVLDLNHGQGNPIRQQIGSIPQKHLSYLHPEYEWLSFFADSIGALESQIEMLVKNPALAPISHIMIISHGHNSKYSNGFIISIGEHDQLEFSSTDSELATRIFSKLKPRLAPHPKVYFGGCDVLMGDEVQASAKARTISQVFGVPSLEIFGHQGQGSPVRLELPIPTELTHHDRLFHSAMTLFISETIWKGLRGLAQSIVLQRAPQFHARAALPLFTSLIFETVKDLAYVAAIVGFSHWRSPEETNVKQMGYRIDINDAKIELEEIDHYDYFWSRFL